MRPELLLCVSQQAVETPYQFKATGTHVYAFEEALFHVYHYWKQSVDDFLSDELIGWVNDVLGLSFLAARMKELARLESFSRKLLSFLRLVPYFNSTELESLRTELLQWEKRLEWEKLKERADYLTGRGDPDKALVLYRRALQHGENVRLLNNMAVALMQIEEYQEAYKHLRRAAVLEKDNIPLFLHYIESAVYSHRFEEAERALEKAERQAPGHRDIPFLWGLLCSEQGEYTESIRHYERAIAMSSPPEAHFVYKLADVFINMRQYDKAIAALELAAAQDVSYYVKQAELYAAANNIPAAAKSIQKALMIENTNSGLWVRLAMYHRLDYDLNGANGAITRALSLDPENSRAQLENARIKKAMGRTKEYQSVLNNVLKDFKQKYREYI